MFAYPKEYEVLVVGGGHAGVEAALAASRLGCTTLLLTQNLDTIAQMSCNPAVGGLAKGHLVREIDALGGEIGRNTDMTGLQFRMLNTRKGPAVWAPRAQCDKKAYQFRLKWVCERQPNLDCKQGQVEELIVEDGQVRGIRTSVGVGYNSRTVVLTTGTFLKGLIHVGDCQQAMGRFGESSVNNLSGSLRRIGLELGRLKTGTPPRLLRGSIDFAKTTVQEGDEPVPFFSHWKDDLFHVEQPCSWQSAPRKTSSGYPPGSVLAKAGRQLPCHITYTTKQTAELVRANLNRSPLYSGTIIGVGPRYCPSIEDKIMRFGERDRHQIFLEPEGLETEEIYVNGFSSSLPFDVQVGLVRTIVGCERAEIMRPAYAVEYDFAFPTQLLPSLECKCCRNLFLAGQINGTSGYEEAAAQGLMAGINAARRVCGLDPIVLGRDQAYIGVLIDDLVTKGTNEPYRMFTSRAEHRLFLRQDNADMRLSELGYRIGLLPLRNFEQVRAKQVAVLEELRRLESTKIGSEALADLLTKPEVHYSDLPSQNPSLREEVIQQIEIEVKYAAYIRRQRIQIEKLKAWEDRAIPSTFDYSAVPGLKTEARLKLQKVRPTTLGQASRIPGVSPADVSLVMVWLKRTFGDQA